MEIFESSGKKLKPDKVSYNSALSKYREAMRQKKYSEATIKSYLQYFQRFLNYYKEITPEKISDDQMREYILYLVVERKYSVSSQNLAISAIKNYYQAVLGRDIDKYYLTRPRGEKRLPIILNKVEVSMILKSINNLKYKCMIFLVYSAGLTPSEICYIKVEDINSEKMQIFISSAKGDKDRYVILSQKILDLLREYFIQFNPQKWLFEGSNGSQFPTRSLQKAFQKAVKNSGINKSATLTILKNSFAVHLIEKGVDIRYIQKMLGHKHSNTTMKYLRVSKRDLSAIQSPLDNLDV